MSSGTSGPRPAREESCTRRQAGRNTRLWDLSQAELSSNHHNQRSLLPSLLPSLLTSSYLIMASSSSEIPVQIQNQRKADALVAPHKLNDGTTLLPIAKIDAYSRNRELDLQAVADLAVSFKERIDVNRATCQVVFFPKDGMIETVAQAKAAWKELCEQNADAVDQPNIDWIEDKFEVSSVPNKIRPCLTKLTEQTSLNFRSRSRAGSIEPRFSGTGAGPTWTSCGPPRSTSRVSSNSSKLKESNSLAVREGAARSREVE